MINSIVLKGIVYNIATLDSMTLRQINKLFRSVDESSLWPICGRFNATERAIRRLRPYKLRGAEYALALDVEISNIVNGV